MFDIVNTDCGLALPRSEAMIHQDTKIFHDEPDEYGRVYLLDEEGFVIARGLTLKDAKWLIAAHRVKAKQSEMA